MRRLVSIVAASFAGWVFICLTFLPYDSPSVLWIRFTATRFVSVIQSPPSAQEWMSRDPAFPVNFDTDVAFIIKTGYGTQERVPAQIDALGQLLDSETYGNTLVIGDFATEFHIHGHSIVVHDVIKRLAHDDALASEQGHERILKYKQMTATIKAGNKEESTAAVKSFGWELDALKVSFSWSC